jgi:hypothetical protein
MTNQTNPAPALPLPGSDEWYQQEAERRAHRLNPSQVDRLLRLGQGIAGQPGPLTPDTALNRLSGRALCAVTWLAVWDDTITAGMLEVFEACRFNELVDVVQAAEVQTEPDESPFPRVGLAVAVHTQVCDRLMKHRPDPRPAA